MKSKMTWAPRRNFSASPDAALMESRSLIGRSVSLPLKRLLRPQKTGGKDAQPPRSESDIL